MRDTKTARVKVGIRSIVVTVYVAPSFYVASLVFPEKVKINTESEEK